MKELADAILRFRAMIAMGAATIAILTGFLTFNDKIDLVTQSGPFPLASKIAVGTLAQNFEKQNAQIQNLANTVKSVEQRQDGEELKGLIAQRGDLKLRLRSAPHDALLNSILATTEARIIELTGGARTKPPR